MKNWLFEVGNWSRLPMKLGYDDESIFKNKRNILFSQITFFSSATSVFYFGVLAFSGDFRVSILGLMMAAVLLSAYFLNEAGHHRISKVLALTLGNLAFLVYSIVAPASVAMFVFFFPLITASVLIFNRSENWLRITFSLASIGSIVMALSLRFWGVRVPEFEVARPEFVFMLNVGLSILMTAGFVYLMMRLNEDVEAKLRRLAEEVKQKNADLQRTNEQLDRFVYSASHDIKLPVIAIKGLANLARAEGADETSLTYFKRIENQADKLGAFLLEMLEYTRNGKTGLRLEKVNLTQLVDDVIEGLSHLENAQRVEFKKFIRIEGEVMIDRIRFMVILNNLISNAIKFHNYNLENPWIKIMISRVDTNIQVLVADNGLGIHDKFRDKVFEMFFRAPSLSSLETEEPGLISASPLGTGLGLYIVKETVEKMNGRIMLSSTEGEGACFRIDLPLVA